MTVYLAPCGISILGGLKRGRGAPVEVAKGTGAGAVTELLDRFDGVELDTDAGRPVLDQWHAAFAEVNERLRLEDWHGGVSAETSTLLARRGDRNPDPRASELFDIDETVVLLASDTPAGLVGALLVAARITGGNAERVRYAETPGEPGEGGEYQINPGQVTVVRVRGLDPRANDAFTQAAWGTGDVMRAVQEVPNTDRIDVHLSGGFKAVLLHTLALTEVMRSEVDSTAAEVRACYLYEDGDDRGSPGGNLIEIGLRRVSEGTLRTMRDELVSVRDDRRLDSAEFEDVAWDRAEGRPRLNAFGHGYLAVLGNPNDTSDDATYVR